MIDPKKIEEFCNRFNGLIAASPAADIEKNIRAALSGFFAKLDLVSREEFDSQMVVLARTRARLESLEAKVAELEARLLPPGE